MRKTSDLTSALGLHQKQFGMGSGRRGGATFPARIDVTAWAMRDTCRKRLRKILERKPGCGSKVAHGPVPAVDCWVEIGVTDSQMRWHLTNSPETPQRRNPFLRRYSGLGKAFQCFTKLRLAVPECSVPASRQPLQLQARLGCVSRVSIPWIRNVRVSRAWNFPISKQHC